MSSIESTFLAAVPPLAQVDAQVWPMFKHAQPAVRLEETLLSADFNLLRLNTSCAPGQ
jgi:hypothetical protein